MRPIDEATTTALARLAAPRGLDTRAHPRSPRPWFFLGGGGKRFRALMARRLVTEFRQAHPEARHRPAGSTRPAPSSTTSIIDHADGGAVRDASPPPQDLHPGRGMDRVIRDLWPQRRDSRKETSSSPAASAGPTS